MIVPYMILLSFAPLTLIIEVLEQLNICKNQHLIV